MKQKVVAHRGRPEQSEVLRSSSQATTEAVQDNPRITTSTQASAPLTVPVRSQTVFAQAARVPRQWGVPDITTKTTILPSELAHSEDRVNVTHPTPTTTAENAHVHKISKQANKTSDGGIAQIQGLQHNFGGPKVPAPTSQTCPPPDSNVPPSELARLRLERAKQACSPPPFYLGFDSPEEIDKQALNSETNPATVGVMAGVDIVIERLYDEDDWDDDTWKEAIDAVDRVEVERGYRNTATLIGSKEEQVVSVFKAPARVGNSTAANGEMSGSTTAALRPQVQERRIIRLPPCLKSPYLT
jgi:hypothetical protein